MILLNLQELTNYIYGLTGIELMPDLNVTINKIHLNKIEKTSNGINYYGISQGKSVVINGNHRSGKYINTKKEKGENPFKHVEFKRWYNNAKTGELKPSYMFDLYLLTEVNTGIVYGTTFTYLVRLNETHFMQFLHGIDLIEPDNITFDMGEFYLDWKGKKILIELGLYNGNSSISVKDEHGTEIKDEHGIPIRGTHNKGSIRKLCQKLNDNILNS